MRVAFSCDDVCPKTGYGLLLDYGPLKYLRMLNDEFGCKFTLFVVPFWHDEEALDIRKQTTWFNKLKDAPFFEIAAHGLTHNPLKPEWGGQEFLQRPLDEVRKRVLFSKQFFAEAGTNVRGFKSPGWFQPKEIYEIVKNADFDYIADHFIGTKPIVQNNITKIPYTFTINQLFHTQFSDDDTLILHSHVSREYGNMNGWNEELYEVVRKYLLFLTKTRKVEFVFMKDLVQ